MKKITLIIAIAALALTSCKKQNELEPEKKVTPIYVAFAGTYQSTFHCYINNQEKAMSVVYEVKKGDVCTIVDNGSDNYVNAVHLHLIGGNGACRPSCTQGYLVQGFTGGIIQVTTDGKTTNVREYQGNGDTNLTYIIQ